MNEQEKFAEKMQAEILKKKYRLMDEVKQLMKEKGNLADLNKASFAVLFFKLAEVMTVVETLAETLAKLVDTDERE